MRTVFRAMFYDPALVKDDLVELAYALHLERGDGATIRSVLETLASPAEKLDAALTRMRVPTLILWGDHDAITPLAMAHVFHRRIAGFAVADHSQMRAPSLRSRRRRRSSRR